MPCFLYTIGYEGRNAPELLDELSQVGVDRLVDVRELPLSRKPGLSKTALSEALGQLGIEYLHVRALGNPKENRERYRAGDVQGGARNFHEHLHNGSSAALVELAETLDHAVTCLLCFERDHSRCHRDVIADSLEELRPELVVKHL
jgi:uncharacterized protein (DUF488 family)